jgi:hypothetical protein
LIGHEEITMYLKHDFQPLRLTGIRLADQVDQYALSELLVVFHASDDDGLYEHTNVDALVRGIEKRCGKGSALLCGGDCGEAVALVAPDGEDAIAHAQTLLATIEFGTHLDEALFYRALDERVADYWDQLSIPDRIILMQSLNENVGLALHEIPPPAAMPELREHFV